MNGVRRHRRTWSQEKTHVAHRNARLACPSEMIEYLTAFNLNYGAFDFVITPDGEWIMLECNPSGQWLWLHHVAGLPIPEALADLLTGGRRDHAS